MPYIQTRTWNALTCRFEGTDIYLGLASARDDLAILLDQRVLRTFPPRDITITSGSAKRIPLRVYSVRDPSIVRITLSADPADEQGFQRVRLDFNVSGVANPPSDPSIEDRSPPVMAFLLVTGLKPEDEDEFYGQFEHGFLHRAWMTFPRLLREMGCATPEELVSGKSLPCPTPPAR